MPRDSVAELSGIEDAETRNAVPMITEVIENSQAVRQALAAAFDHPRVTELLVFNIGDGQALSGLLVAARSGDSGETVMLVFLMD
jgi:hypothetical protein